MKAALLVLITVSGLYAQREISVYEGIAPGSEKWD